MLELIKDDLFDTIELGLIICETKSYQIKWVNRALHSLIETKDKPITVSDLFSDFSKDTVTEKLLHFNSYSCVVHSQGQNKSFELICSLREKNNNEYIFIECFPKYHSDHEVINPSKLKAILETTDKAYFIVSRNFKILECYNTKSVKFQESECLNKEFTEVFKLSEKDEYNITFSIQLLENNLVEWPDFEDLNDDRYTIGHHIFHITFKQYAHSEDDPITFFVTIEDITQSVLDEQEHKKNESLQRMLLAIMTEQESFIHFLGECNKIIQTMMYELEQETITENQVNNLFRAVHTIKGNASAFEMTDVAIVSEVAESYLREVRSSIEEVTEETLDELRDKVLEVIDKFNETRETLAHTLGAIFKDWESGKRSISGEKLNELTQLVHEDPKLKSHRELRKITESFFSKSLGSMLQRYVKLIKNIAEGCDKKLYPLEIDGGEIEVNADRFSTLIESLVHVFRNAVDHGIESPEHRIDCGKNPMGHIRVTALQDLEYISLIIEDDGAGIPPNKIREKALEKQILTAEEIEQLSDEEVIDLVFAPGFSTSEEVTDISGNGVGMDAVRTAARAIGGEIAVVSTLGKGTKFYIDIPILN